MSELRQDLPAVEKVYEDGLDGPAVLDLVSPKTFIVKRLSAATSIVIPCPGHFS
jgi:hypothetical protein